MTKKASVKLYKKLERRLTEKGFLKRIKLSKKAMLALLIQNNWKEKAQNLETQRADCRGDPGTGGRYDAPDISCAGGRMAFLYL